MLPTWTDEKYGIALYLGDCLDVMKTLPENSVDAVVTDPPYSYKFMSKKWDADLPGIEIWKECIRLLKPGGFLLSFGGCRTYHRLVCNIEDAGFIIHPLIAWIFGSGFPKAANLSKRIDQKVGEEREVIGTQIVPDIRGGKMHANREKGSYEIKISAPASEAAKQWDGFFYGLQALKPAIEPICMAQKPYEGKPVDSILKWNCGALNIGGCQVGSELRHNSSASQNKIYGQFQGKEQKGRESVGRWPANVILEGSEEVVSMFPKQVGSGKFIMGGPPRSKSLHIGQISGQPRTDAIMNYGDSGSAARFFYCAKSSQADRDSGLEGMPLGDPPGSGRSKPAPGAKSALGQPRANFHPTVKPVDLMQYLCRLVTPPGGIVLDPFMGSGSTGKGAIHEDMKFVGIEREETYLNIATARIKKAILDVGPGPLFAEEKNERNRVDR